MDVNGGVKVFLRLKFVMLQYLEYLLAYDNWLSNKTSDWKSTLLLQKAKESRSGINTTVRFHIVIKHICYKKKKNLILLAY